VQAHAKRRKQRNGVRAPAHCRRFSRTRLSYLQKNLAGTNMRPDYGIWESDSFPHIYKSLEPMLLRFAISLNYFGPIPSCAGFLFFSSIYCTYKQIEYLNGSLTLTASSIISTNHPVLPLGSDCPWLHSHLFRTTAFHTSCT